MRATLARSTGNERVSNAPELPHQLRVCARMECTLVVDTRHDAQDDRRPEHDSAREADASDPCAQVRKVFEACVAFYGEPVGSGQGCVGCAAAVGLFALVGLRLAGEHFRALGGVDEHCARELHEVHADGDEAAGEGRLQVRFEALVAACLIVMGSVSAQCVEDGPWELNSVDRVLLST